MSGNVKGNFNLTSARSEEHLLPAFRASIVWIENILRLPISMKCGFRGALASGVVLCRLLNAIEPGTIRRINQCPNRASATDNLSLFLYACEETFEIPQSRMFSVYDFEDIFDQGVDANTEQHHDMKHSEKVVITLFWLAKSVDLRDRSNYLSKLDYNAFSALIPKTLIQRKFSVSGSTSSTPVCTAGDPDDISCYSDVSSIRLTKRHQHVVSRRVSQPTEERLVIITPRSHPTEDNYPVMGNFQTAPPHSSTETIKELGDAMPRSKYNVHHINGVDMGKGDNSKHSSVLIERIPQPPHPSSPYPPPSESGHAEIIITNIFNVECRSPDAHPQPTPASEPASEAAVYRSDLPSTVPSPEGEATHEPLTTLSLAAKTNGIYGSMPYQLNNNMIIEEGEEWQSSLAEWRERRRKLSRSGASRMASLVAEEEADAARRAEEVRERLRKLKTQRSLAYEGHFFPMPSEIFSPPPSSPGIALLTGVGPKLSEIADESEQQHTDDFPLSSAATDIKSAWNPQQHQPAVVDSHHVMDNASGTLSGSIGVKINGHPSDQDSHTESPGKLDASLPVNPTITPETRPTAFSTVPSESTVKDKNNGDDYKVVKFYLQCKPGSKEARWGLTIRGEGPNSSTPFVVDHIKIGSAADISEINKDDILVDINGKNVRQGKPTTINTVKELEQLMDSLASAKKPISVRVLRKNFRADEFSDTEFGGETSPLVSAADAAPRGANSDSDVDGKIWEDSVVAVVPPPNSQHPSHGNGHEKQLIADDWPHAEIRSDMIGTNHQFKQPFAPNELLKLSQESSRQPTILSPLIHRTDTLDDDMSVNMKLLQSSAPVTPNTT